MPFRRKLSFAALLFLNGLAVASAGTSLRATKIEKTPSNAKRRHLGKSSKTDSPTAAPTAAPTVTPQCFEGNLAEILAQCQITGNCCGFGDGTSDTACVDWEDGASNIEVCEHSCNGERACERLTENTSIGPGSCNGLGGTYLACSAAAI